MERPFGIRLLRNLLIGAAIGTAFALAQWQWFPDVSLSGYLHAFLLGAGLALVYWSYKVWAFRQGVLHKLHALDQAEGGNDIKLNAKGVFISSLNAHSALGWPVISAITAVKGGTALRYGASQLAIPDTALPSGLTPDAFRARITAWKNA
jgi:hypothetical protein